MEVTLQRTDTEAIAETAPRSAVGATWLTLGWPAIVGAVTLAADECVQRVPVGLAQTGQGILRLG